MIFILYGSDTYRSRKKLNEIVAEYRTKTGSSLNLHRLDMEEHEPAELKVTLEVQSLFASKKLVVVEHAWSGQSGAAAAMLEERITDIAGSKDLIVIVWDGELNPLQKKQAAKLEKQAAKSQEFEALQGEHLVRWIRAEAASQGVPLGTSDAGKLALLGDSWAIVRSLEKMAATGSLETVPSARKLTIFQLGDAFFQNSTAGIRVLQELLDQGEDEFALFSYLAGHTRTLAAVKYYADKHQPIPASQKIHPFVAKKAGALVRAISMQRLRQTIQRFFEEDVKIKTGLSKPGESLLNILLSS